MTHVSTYVTIHPFTNIHNVPLPKEVTHSLSKLNLPNTTVATPQKVARVSTLPSLQSIW